MLDTHQLSISQAARVANISRSHLYQKYINQGLISTSETLDGTKFIDASEVARVFNKQEQPTDDTDVLLAQLKKDNEKLEARNEKLSFSLMLANDEASKQVKREEFLQKTVVALSHRLTHESTGSNTTENTSSTASKHAKGGVLTRLIKWLI